MTRDRVLAHVLARDDEAVIGACLTSLAAQDHPALTVVVSDNGSTDGTRSRVRQEHSNVELCAHGANLGYAAGHNHAVARGGFDHFLALNADVVLRPDFISRLVAASRRDPRCGMATGKLLRPGGRILDSTGLVLDRFRRNGERGSGEPDRGQYDQPDEVFGAFGAAALYTRELIADLAPDGRLFDEAFFAFREEVDLAWRAQARGWRCRYEPSAVATHEHRYRPETRATRPAAERRLQRRNRYLLLIKNESPSGLLRDLGHLLVFEAAALAQALVREPELLPAYTEVLRRLPALWAERRRTRDRRTVPDRRLHRWFRQG